ncbi:MAG: hypothetical protein NDJ19_06335 [Ramlibacter sp.]|nr:hypothetical protein [Ramlibacter sp.]
MPTDRDHYALLQAEYRAVAAQERAEWKALRDGALGPVDRVKAYARWVKAAERVKLLSISMRELRATEESPPH